MSTVLSAFVIVLAMSAYYIGLSSKVNNDHYDIITAIKDNGCASKQVLRPVVMRIDNYNIKAL